MSVWQSICEKLGLVLCEVWSGLPSVVRGGVRVVSRKESDKKKGSGKETGTGKSSLGVCDGCPLSQPYRPGIYTFSLSDLLSNHDCLCNPVPSMTLNDSCRAVGATQTDSTDSV